MKNFRKKIQKLRILKQSHSAEKLERGDPLAFLKFQFAAKHQKNLKGGPFGDKKNRENSRTVPKNIQIGDPVVPSGFVSYVKNRVHERTFCTNLDAFPLAGRVV